MQKRRAILWFRQDLRLHDNEALTDALRCADELIPVYIFDERVFNGYTRFGFPKTGHFRAQFILEAVADLKASLQKLGSNLIIKIGKPEEELFEIARKAQSNWVFCNRERTKEEVEVQDKLEKKLWTIGQEMRYSRGKMLYHTADLPFPVTHTPDVFSQFRKEVERFVPIRQPLPAPTKIFQPVSVQLDPGHLPTLKELGYDSTGLDERAVMPFIGGETAGLERLKYYLWDSQLVKSYKDTRNGMLGGDYSSKFSPWLAQGCLSPKLIYHEIQRFEAAHGSNESTQWLILELMWRDFFRFMAKKHGNKIFLIGGTKGAPDTRWRNDRHLLQKWIEGTTGVPFIDANMRELKLTGFMSNRGRQNVASFLTKDLLVNWQMGAEYFESMLIDYDPCSNWGNWNYVAAVGSDPRENRYFNILTQAHKYDPNGAYVKFWLPELANLPQEWIHRPDRMSESIQRVFNFRLGTHYPDALVSSDRWE